ncbi:RagB/SusD family nutrient uptake outer membrane protein [Penaeicola halotolerans]|uniref:RagB/SusD family nutrient uptake outer membrane protein n=1 Tax=Penaeicola halotolerans TaxID=2793196 RepID=UPI001CF921FC|nr:RagB/SusD family nutrient uptake outer membrane protein [Penaeicola halotolerans]
MKKRFNKIIALVFASILIFQTSCDTLEQDPVNSIDVNGAITTLANANRAILGVYSAMQSGNYYGLRYLYYQDVYTDNLQHAGTFTTDQEVSARIINPSNLQIRSTWQTMYAVISNANFILSVLEDITDASPEQLAALEAEARFLRALVYYDMLKVFGGVPIVTDFITDTESLNFAPRATEADLYTFIIEDLTFAEDNLQNTANAPFRARPLSATALLARVYLQQGNNTMAASKAAEVIDAGVYSLQNNYADIFSIKGNSEMILELAFSNTDQNTLSISSNPATGGQKFYLRNAFLNEFAASGAQGDERFAASVLVTSRNRVVKYFRSTTNDDNVPLIRLAEMYLIKAEANARLAGSLTAITPTSVIDDINEIRGRAGLADVTILDIPTVEDALDEILTQRRFELAFEGHRFADLKRFGQAAALYGNEPFRVLWPIPLVEIEVNSNLEQNVGYTNN